MSKWSAASAILCVCVCATPALAQSGAKVDFKRDVQPIFQSNCIGCHGPKTQKNNFRLDRRSDAMRGGTIAVIGPGNSEGSRLYRRLIGDEYGLRMPPTGPLSNEQVNIIKAWIDQGAEWPDDASGETPPPPPDPVATRMMEALRNGDRRALARMVREQRSRVNAKGAGGSTPLMYAALYGDPNSVRLLLANGADPNIKNEAGATALMWATDSLEKTQLLLEHGANVNAVSQAGRTALLAAAARSGSSPVVKALLDHGANPSARSITISGVMTPLAEAAYVGDSEVVRLLIERGEDLKHAVPNRLGNAVASHCEKCADLLVGHSDVQDLNLQLVFDAPPFGDGLAIKYLLEHGAEARTKDFAGTPVFVKAAASDTLPVEALKAMMERGADVNWKSVDGQTALTLAKGRGHTAVVDLLMQAGATDVDPDSMLGVKPSAASSARVALERSIPLLQRTDVSFSQKSGCISCHNNSLTASTVVAARKIGVGVNEQMAKQQLATIGAYIEGWREKLLQGVGIPGDSDSVGYILFGLAAEHYSPDPATDAMARFLKNHQTPGGNWFPVAHRPPLESSTIQVTAVCIRAMQVYAPKTQRPEYQASIQRGASWLKTGEVATTEDKVFRLLGLSWAKADRQAIRSAAQSLLADQRADGGWAQMPTLGSDAYATGQALVALRESGMMRASDAACKRGASFLMSSQFADGSWYVKTRALPLQPYFDAGFPYGRAQYISAAATNWAAKALALAQ